MWVSVVAEIRADVASQGEASGGERKQEEQGLAGKKAKKQADAEDSDLTEED